MLAKSTLLFIAPVLAALIGAPVSGAMIFEDPSSWDVFDPGNTGLGNDPDGYVGAVSDGRHIYFVPYMNGTEWHGEVLRYDTHDEFSSTASWATYDPGAHGVGTDPIGYHGGVFDGRYVYFVPFGAYPDFHGEVLRYDTQADFSSASSWDAYDAGAHGVGSDPDGYRGAVFSGRYIYFVPGHNGTEWHGEVLRYDTTVSFSDASSWAAFDPGANGVGNDPDGYFWGACDGRYVYFAPFGEYSTNNLHGEVLRHDTQGDFSSPSSWEAYDAGAHGVGTDPDGYIGAAFDGRYVYFAPFFNEFGQAHGEVLRYDTQSAFSDAAAWATFDAGNNGVGVDPDGYVGAVFDGQYVYFVPYSHETDEFHTSGEVLRYDTEGDFFDPLYWATFDAVTNSPPGAKGGYHGAVFEGEYVYFVPKYANGEKHGEVLRYWVPEPTMLSLLALGGLAMIGRRR